MADSIERNWTEIDKFANDWVKKLAELSPEFATYAGLPGDPTAYSDYSPAGHEEVAEAEKTALATIRGLTPTDHVDEVTKSELITEFELSGKIYDSGWALRDLNNIASPAQDIRDALDLMPMDSAEDWANIAGRIGNIPTAIDQYIETLSLGIERGITPAVRQVNIVADQVNANVGSTGFFAKFAGEASTADGELPESIKADLERNGLAASAAYERLREFLVSRELPVAVAQDGVGRDFYELLSQRFVGMKVDLDETYEWGLEELAREKASQEAVANEIKPGASVAEAIEALEADESTKLYGTDALQAWMQNLSNEAIDFLGREHFEIPAEVRTLECMIAPTNTGVIYYTAPNNDFSRPGRMWWSVPAGVTSFNTWRETTTVSHEGVPGHHLQLGLAVYQRNQLNDWRRLAAGASGFFEGWALYAERFMDKLGYLKTPGDRLGMLDGQRMRAARVVLDMGVHLGKKRPDGSGLTWSGDYAHEFFAQHCNMDAASVAFEANRYLGWPGQAPSYKIGQRVWEQTRDDYLAAHPAASLREFHQKALTGGSLSLTGLRFALGL